MKRKSLTASAVGLALVFLGVIGCTEVPLETQPAASPTDASSTYRMLDVEVIQSVTGSGHLVDRPVERTVTFNIFKRADGTVEGWYHSVARGPGGAHIRVSMECLHVAGNEAWATGTVVAAVDPNNIGRPYSVHFLDNGEGADAAPDEIGTERFVGYDCTSEPDIPTRPLMIGNLRIRE